MSVSSANREFFSYVSYDSRDEHLVQFYVREISNAMYLQFTYINEQNLAWLNTIQPNDVISFEQAGVVVSSAKVLAVYNTENGFRIEEAPSPALNTNQQYAIGLSRNRPIDQIPTPPENRGWSPVLAAEIDGERVVLRIQDWTSGQGTKPQTGYIGSTGIVADIANGVDIWVAVRNSGIFTIPTFATGTAYRVHAPFVFEGSLYRAVSAIADTNTDDVATLLAAGTIELIGDDEETTLTIPTFATTTAYSVDEPFVFEGELYRVTTAIAGTNSQTVAQLLAAGTIEKIGSADELDITIPTFAINTAYVVDAPFISGGDLYRVRTAIATSNTSTVSELVTANTIELIGGGLSQSEVDQRFESLFNAPFTATKTLGTFTRAAAQPTAMHYYATDDQLLIANTNTDGTNIRQDLVDLQDGEMVVAGDKIFINEFSNQDSGYIELNGYWAGADPDSVAANTDTTIRIIKHEGRMARFVKAAEIIRILGLLAVGSRLQYSWLDGKPNSVVLFGAYAASTAIPANRFVTHEGSLYWTTAAIPDTNTDAPDDNSSFQNISEPDTIINLSISGSTLTWTQLDGTTHDLILPSGGGGGAVPHFVTSAPDDASGSNGDTAYDTTNGKIYHKTGGTWVERLDLVTEAELRADRDKGDVDETRIRHLETLTSEIIERTEVTWNDSAEVEFSLLGTDTDLSVTTNITNAAYGTSDTINAYQRFFVALRVPLARNIAEYRIRHTHNANVYPDHVYTPLVGSSGAWNLLATDATYRYYVHAGYLQLHNSDVLQVQKATETILTEYAGELSTDEVIAALGNRVLPVPSGANSRDLPRINQAGNSYDTIDIDNSLVDFVFNPNPIERGNEPTDLRLFFRTPAGAFPDATHGQVTFIGNTSAQFGYNPNSNGFHSWSSTLTDPQLANFKSQANTADHLDVTLRLFHGSDTDFTYTKRIIVVEPFTRPAATKAQAEDPNETDLLEFSPQRIHEAIDVILPPTEHGSVFPSGVANRNSTERDDYVLTLGEPSRTITNANRIRISFEGIEVHNDTWTTAQRVVPFEVNSTEAAAVGANLSASDTEIGVQVEFRQDATVVDVLNLAIGIGHDILTPEVPLPAATKAQAEDPTNTNLLEFSPQRIHQAIDTILPGTEHGSISPAGIADDDSIERNYVIVLGEPSRTITNANRIRIHFAGVQVHDASWTTSNRVISFGVSSTEAASVNAALADAATEILVSVEFRQGGTLLDTINLAVGIGHEELTPDEPLELMWNQELSINIAIGGPGNPSNNTWISTGWTIPATGLFEITWFAGNADWIVVATGQRLRTLDTDTIGGDIHGTGEGLVKRLSSQERLYIGRTTGNILIVGASVNSADPEPLEIRRIL